jgi:hypothetical protein
MAPARVRILKKSQVKASGTVRLTPGHVAPVRTTCSARADVPQADLQPRSARIVESNDEYAVIEVVCSCGAKNHIQCNYADIAKSEQ